MAKEISVLGEPKEEYNSPEYAGLPILIRNIKVGQIIKRPSIQKIKGNKEALVRSIYLSKPISTILNFKENK